MRQIARLALSALGLVLGAVLMVVVPASPAQAIDCDWTVQEQYGVVWTKHKICQNFNKSFRGASVTETYSDYTYWARAQAEGVNILHIMRLKDTRANGKCASVWASKEGGPTPFKAVEQIRVCGKGKSKKFQMDWENWEMAEGTLVLWLCGARACRAFWAQNLPPYPS